MHCTIFCKDESSNVVDYVEGSATKASPDARADRDVKLPSFNRAALARHASKCRAQHLGEMMLNKIRGQLEVPGRRHGETARGLTDGSPCCGSAGQGDVF